jgi:hypothetical protein
VGVPSVPCHRYRGIWINPGRGPKNPGIHESVSLAGTFKFRLSRDRVVQGSGVGAAQGFQIQRFIDLLTRLTSSLMRSGAQGLITVLFSDFTVLMSMANSLSRSWLRAAHPPARLGSEHGARGRIAQVSLTERVLTKWKHILGEDHLESRYVDLDE